jgi:hypothetical protein
VTAVEERISGSEAAALYGRLVSERREHEQEARLLRDIVIGLIHRNGGDLSIPDLVAQSRLPLPQLLPILTDLLEDGQVLSEGVMLRLLESAKSTP